MATRKPNPVSVYLAEIGARGGEAKVSKGFGRMDPEKRAAALKKSLATRRANAKKKAAK